MHYLTTLKRLLVLSLVAALLLTVIPGLAQDDETMAEAAEEVEAEMGDWDLPDPENLPDTVTMGIIFDLSGGAALYGEVQQQGAQLAIEEINASGYLGENTTLEALFEDGGSADETSINAMTKLVEQDQVVAVIGPTLSREAFAADPIAAEAGIPVMGVSNTAVGITSMTGDEATDQLIFRDSLPESAVIPGTISQAIEILGLERVGVIYANDDDFTVSGYEVFVEALEENGIEITTEETYATGDVDFNAQLTNIIGTEPDAIIASSLAVEGALIATQARQLGFEGPIIGGNGFNSPAIIEQAGEAAEGIIVGAAWHITNPNPLNEAFVMAYEEAYETSPDQFAAQAYTGVWLMATAIRAADSADPAAIRDELAAIEDFDSPLGLFSFAEDRNPIHEPVAQIIVEGTFELLSEASAAAVYGE